MPPPNRHGPGPTEHSGSVPKAENYDPFDQGEINTPSDAWIDRLVQPVGWLVLIVAFISVYEVFTRYALNAPTKWVHETSTFLTAVVFLIGGVRALARNQHVQINLVQYFLPKRHRHRLRLINGFLLIIICAALVYVSGLTAWQATHARPGEFFYFERTGTFWNPPFPAWIKITLFVTCVLMTIQAMAQFRRQLRLARSSGFGVAGNSETRDDDGPV